MTWATTADCIAVTGSAPVAAPPATSTGDGTLALAHSMIETYCGRTADAEGSFTTRDLGWLKRAVAWQAAWLPGQPGVLARMGATGVQQDGVSATFVSPADVAVAPLAQRALKNCTWMGSRSIRTRPRAPLDGTGATSAAAFLRESSDPEEGWSPL